MGTKLVIYDDENSPLERSYVALSITKTKKWYKKQFIVKVIEDTEDVKEELIEDLKKIRQIFS